MMNQLRRLGLALLSVGSLLMDASAAYASQGAHCKPDTEAVKAWALLEQGKSADGCKLFLTEVQKASRDPWVYRGAALCAANDLDSSARAFIKALEQKRVRPALAAFGRGFYAWVRKDYEPAERELRRATRLAPRLALAHNALGAILKAGGDVAGSIPSIQAALKQCPKLDLARRNLVDAKLRLQVFDRMLTRLEAISRRWSKLPSAVINPSGRSAEQVLGAASQSEIQAANLLISRQALTQPKNRPGLLKQERARRNLGEIDLWLPLLLASQEQVTSVDEAALTVDAWLMMAEELGRRDVLFEAAGMALMLSSRRATPERVLRAAKLWASLKPDTHSNRGAAMVAQEYAALLFSLGDNEGALKAYRQARTHFVAVGDKLGQGNTFKGEADVLFRQGDNEGALKAYRQARTHFVAVGSQLGQGNTWDSEANVLFRQGDNQGALAAYRQARTHFVAVGDKLGQGNTFKGEADVLFLQGDNEGALAAYRQARTHFVAVGDKQGEGSAWSGEARCLEALGKSSDAVTAARKAVAGARAAGHQGNEILSRGDLATSLASAGQEGQSIREAYHTLKLLRSWRGKGLSDLDRTAMGNIATPYDILIPLLAQKPRKIRKALDLSEAAHAPVLLDLLSTEAGRATDTDDLRLLQERERLHKDRVELDRRLARTRDSLARARIRDRQRDVDRKLTQNELASLATLDKAFLVQDPIKPAARRALVQKTGPVLMYYVAPRQTVGFLLLPGARKPIVRVIPLSRYQAWRDVRAFRHNLGNSLWEKRSHKQARAFYDHLIAPFADKLQPYRRLLLVPHGPLHQLPFEALRDLTDKPLFDRWDISIVPSLSILHALRARKASRKARSSPSLLALAAGEGLFFPDQEILDIARWFGANKATSFQGETDYDMYAHLAPKADYLLMSTHGVHEPNSRSGTYLEIKPSDTHDRRLSASEIAQISLRAELVTLAACDTARAEALLSDERLDLSRAFLIAGASAVLATRWKIPEDDDTRMFLLDFFQALRTGQGMRKDEALTIARRKARERKAPAQVWAAWVLIGDAR